MKEYVNEHTFRDRFMRSDNYKNNFSYDGLHALFEYFEELEDDCGEEFEFDMIGICGEYAEYDNLKEFKEDYSIWCDNVGIDINGVDDIREETTVIEIPDTERFITGAF